MCVKLVYRCRRASYCEIYNEALYDLLKFTKQQLQVRWDSGKGFYVPELAVKECSSVKDMLEVLTCSHRGVNMRLQWHKPVVTMDQHAVTTWSACKAYSVFTKRIIFYLPELRAKERTSL